ncbi:MAG: hypothetical protein GX774_02910 [Armatimonadetes bacterium]|jgi:hypothetical protein|nr:hypothetical protein [Armatimonadota bacterium]
MNDQNALELKLDAFAAPERREALQALAALPLPAPPPVENVNLHFHSFFSYNAAGWSPSHIAWAAHRAGLYAAGLCDFDVLDGLEEFLQAGELLGLRCTVNLETRVYLKEYAEAEITSPGEPGVTYIMGAGFAHLPAAGTEQAAGLADYRARAQARNLDLVARINPHVPAIALEYERDVLPLTPQGAPTERHIVKAYLNRSQAVYGTPERVAAFWAEILGKPAADVQAMLGTPKMEEAVRSRLVKRGGLGYVQPSVDTFPPADDFIAWVTACGAIPMITWLDGTTDGEKDGRALLECLCAKGARALNIIPDRNWNLADADARAVKVANLRAIVAAADDLGLPINIGTEMNRDGLPFVDDLSGPVLREFKESFLRGAQILVGHSILLRYAGVSYTTSEEPLPARNAFFASVGALPPLTAPVAAKLRALGPEKALTAIHDAAARGSWQA